jgi:glycosyltransferase involved in cell wall biosynthesis
VTDGDRRVTGTATTATGTPAAAEPQVPSEQARSIAFFDGIGTAHSLPLVEGLDRAADLAHVNRQWTTALRPPTAGRSGCAWHETRAFYAEFCAGGRVSPVAYRRAWQDAVAGAQSAGCSVFCDLAIESLTTSFGPPLHVDLPAVWAVHQPPVPRDDRSFLLRTKVLARNPRIWRRRARAAHARSVLRHLSRPPSTFVVPSDAARNRLSQVVPAERIHVLPWPIVSGATPPALALENGTDGEIVAVMPGEARSGKGLDVLLDALGGVEGVSAFDLPTVVTDDARALVRQAGDPRVHMGTTWLSNDDYRARLQAASFAVLPYRTSGTANGGISASLLDVLAVGLPAVVTEPIARMLPAGYGGAVVVAPDDAAALARGITQAVHDLDGLRARARAEGPTFVLAHHTYEQFLAAILALAPA